VADAVITMLPNGAIPLNVYKQAVPPRPADIVHRRPGPPRRREDRMPQEARNLLATEAKTRRD
jgi:hypothetical protein